MQQIWYSDLTATAATAVALLRFTMAEDHICQLVDEAFGDPFTSGFTAVAPIPPPPEGLDEDSALFVRLLDLVDAARRAVLRDANSKSRTRGQQNPSEKRHVDDLAGLTFVNTAYKFVTKVGQRRRLAYDPQQIPDSHQQTYWRFDVVPEVRLNLMRAPPSIFLG